MTRARTLATLKELAAVGACALTVSAGAAGCPTSQGPADLPSTALPFTGGAVVGLSCGETADVTGVTVTGPCAPYGDDDAGDASLSPACSLAITGSLQLRATGPGTCHVSATFGDGTSSSAEVSFALENGELVESTSDITLACDAGEAGMTCPAEPADF